MTDAVYRATAGALIQQYRLEILSNNLANANTIGFKEDRASFLLQPLPETVPAGEEDLSGGVWLTDLSGHPALEYYTNFAQGPLKHSGNPLDLAISGDGFFSIKTPEGIRYTRKGNFTLSGSGLLTTQEGHPVLGESGEIQAEPGTLSVDMDGNILLDGSLVDRFKIVQFNDPAGLKKWGASAFEAIAGDPGAIAADTYEMKQGYVELANVDTIRGMADMIETLRAFEAYQKILDTLDRVDAQTINEVGTLT